MATLCKHGVNTMTMACDDCYQEAVQAAKDRAKALISGRSSLFDNLSKPGNPAVPYTGGYGGINKIKQPTDPSGGFSVSAGPVCAAPQLDPAGNLCVGIIGIYTKDELKKRLKDDVDNLRESEASAFFIERWLKKLK